MKRPGYIIILILFFATRAAGQEKSGDVVVHSDPRLSVLMKKKKAAVASKLPMHRMADGKPAGGKPGVDSVRQGAVAASGQGNAAETASGAPPTSVPPAPVAATAMAGDAAHTKPDAAVPVVKAPVYIREKEGRVIYTGKGYRVLIYNGPDREKAIQIKTEFMRNFPGIRTYVTYVSPSYRVKVGNYRHREEAIGMYKEAKGIYGPCVIVPDIITINTH